MVETFGFSLLYVHALFYSLEAVNLRFVLTIHSFLFLNMGIHEPKGFKNEPKRSRLHKKTYSSNFYTKQNKLEQALKQHFVLNV